MKNIRRKEKDGHELKKKREKKNKWEEILDKRGNFHISFICISNI